MGNQANTFNSKTKRFIVYRPKKYIHRSEVSCFPIRNYVVLDTDVEFEFYYKPDENWQVSSFSFPYYYSVFVVEIELSGN